MKTAWIILMLFGCTVLGGCTGGNTGSVYSSDVYNNQSEQSQDDYDPFAQIVLNSGETVDANFGFGICNPPENNRFIYSDTINIDFWIDNAGQEADFGLRLFVNGILQEYTLDASDEMQTMKQITVGRNERRVCSVGFSPKASEVDSEFVLTYSLTFHPTFAPESETCSFGNNYRLMFNGFPMDHVPDACRIIKTHVLTQNETIPEELAARFYERDGDGNVIGNPLLTGTQLIAERQSPQEQADNALRPADSVKLTLLGGASARKWRISMYCDHELVRAFDGEDYLDMTASSNTMSVYTVPMSVLGERSQKYGSVYFIASPLGADLSDDPLRSHIFVCVSE